MQQPEKQDYLDISPKDKKKTSPTHSFRACGSSGFLFSNSRSSKKLCMYLWRDSAQLRTGFNEACTPIQTHLIYSPFLHQFDWRLTEELVRQQIDLSHSVSQAHRQLLPQEHVRCLLTCIISTWKSGNQKHKQLRTQEGKATKKFFIIHTWNLRNLHRTEQQLINQTERKPKKK